VARAGRCEGHGRRSAVSRLVRVVQLRSGKSRRPPALWAGLAAGAAGTTALNAITYLDMAVRGRPESSTPEDSVRRLAETVGARDLATSEEKQAVHRRAGVAALLGILTGVAAGAGYSVLRRLAGLQRPPGLLEGAALGGLAMLGSNGPMTVMGVTDPRDWSAADWVADVVPHLGYGLAAAGTLNLIERRR
jgi:hypothetical protein